MELLREMAVFAKVVEAGGFSAAARQLEITTSVVSRDVARLEAQLGARLLQRTTRSLALTELGQQVLESCQRVVSSAREVHAYAGSYSASPNGVIKISAPVVFGEVWLAAKLPRFLALYPELDVQLTLIDRQVDLVDEGIDLAIRISQTLAPGLVARPLRAMRYVLVATPAYLAYFGRPKRPADLPQHQCIYLGYARFKEQWSLKKGAQLERVQVPTRMTINNSAAILAAVLADGGIGLVPDFVALAGLRAGELELVLPKWELQEPYTGKVHLAYLPTKHLPLKMRVLIDYLISCDESA